MGEAPRVPKENCGTSRQDDELGRTTRDAIGSSRPTLIWEPSGRVPLLGFRLSRITVLLIRFSKEQYQPVVIAAISPNGRRAPVVVPPPYENPLTCLSPRL